MGLKQRVKKVLEILDDHYPKDIPCYLDHETPWQLLIATILSAQCTDDRVNIVTKTLFQKYKSVEAFANVEITELEQDIKSTGFYRNKAKNIKACCQKLVLEHHSKIPDDIELLTKLDGVGRKTANVVLGTIYKKPSIVVDTHVKRVSNRLGFTPNEDPVKIEYDLMAILPREHWIPYNTQIIAHGRAICRSRSPKCESCFFLPYCPYGLQNQYNTIKEQVKE
ncbi:DNA-(apurinic or apyrimidinic site) lyase /endonuclease III [Natranaerovirga pectinivora]|uniref:Endonuclease III n=1 Tax=Natranaerovirga pectinivora TaxID=682400 RepID=A0A4R3MF81_9FIRM|nr:endonuclease III [Natranaerovirga pectinivora]TCT12165.1 DNA-(apurinic or apyrimidinic site) lyase /endonuclease III [Natranaerovirga pectinivora]